LPRDSHDLIEHDKTVEDKAIRLALW
jgi:hypothetical protein